MSELWRRSRWLLLAAAFAIGGSYLLVASQRGHLADDPLALAPAGARVVAQVDVSTVLRSHLFQALLEEDDARGVRRIERTCGYDPLEQVDQAIVFLFGPDDRPFQHVGFVARGELARGRENRERLVACVRQVMGEQGGGGGVQPVEIEGEPAVASAHGRSHAAFLGDDGVVGGDRSVVRGAIRVHHGDAPSAASDPELRRLWDRVAGDRDIVAVARLPERWLPALRTMARGISNEFEPFGSIRALGVGVRVRGGLSLGAAFETGSAPAAGALERALRAQIDGVLSSPLARLSTLGRALDRVATEQTEGEVVVTVSLTDSQVDGLLALWRDLREDDGEAATEEAEVETQVEPEPAAEPASDVATDELERAPVAPPPPLSQDE